MNTTAQLNAEVDIARVRANLAWLRDNPNAREPAGWREAVLAEARALGLIAPAAGRIGCNCRPGIDRGIVYGGDMEDVF